MTQTSLSALQNQMAPRPGEEAVAVGLTDGGSFALAQRVAMALAKSDLIPARFQQNVSNCLIALNMAVRMGADPLMVMQNLYVVHGTPAWSAQFMIATFNRSGRFSALRYEFVGQEGRDDWGCKAWAMEKETGEKIEGSLVTIALAKKEGWYQKSGSKWQTMPQQMLMYRAASWFIRAYAPEIAMGMHSADELSDSYQYVEPGIMDKPAIDTQAIAVQAQAAQIEAEKPEPSPPPTSSQEAKGKDKPAAKSGRAPTSKQEPAALIEENDDDDEVASLEQINALKVELSRLGIANNTLPNGFSIHGLTRGRAEKALAELKAIPV